jgi:hypothetical protein
MQFSVVALAAFAATAAAWSNGTVTYTTEVLTAYTTVCPAATSFSINGVTYTVTEVMHPQSRYGGSRGCDKMFRLV